MTIDKKCETVTFWESVNNSYYTLKGRIENPANLKKFISPEGFVVDKTSKISELKDKG